MRSTTLANQRLFLALFSAVVHPTVLEDLFGDPINLSQNKAEQDKETDKRAILLRMHASREAIRRTDSAYVLSTVDVNPNWQMCSDLLPGSGANSAEKNRSLRA